MRLESIAIQGFKSFGEKAVVKVLPGITGIVGPNGCGKSNISEAVRWALGEQSAKSLRGQRMEDLIFHGSASRKPVGLAEVALTFSNDGTLSVPWSEIAVARRLYRTGDSEYLLNNGVSRLRDILDLFAGTGANPRAYSVMDQDKLNHVLTAKPHERRVFIEEAAGIARYKQQRNETEGKLDATRQNLTRVRDVMDEVKRQLNSLERQARKAQQYKTLQNEKRELAQALLAADWAALTSEAERLDAEMRALRDNEQMLRTRLAGLSAKEAVQRDAIQVSDHRLGDLRQNLQKVQGELERLLERREQMGVQLRELEDEATRLDDELRVAGERLTTLGIERAQGRVALGEAQTAVSERGTTATTLEAALEAHRGGLAIERDRLEALRLEQVRLAGERTDLMREAGELRERQAQLTRRAERLAAELSQAESEADRLASHRAVLETSRDRVAAELATLAGERERLESLLRDREAALAASGKRLAETRVSLAARRSSYDSVRELDRVREGYGAGVRAVFGEDGRPTIEGVVGTVADLLEVPSGLERAVEAVLGDRLQWVVVERFEHARAGVQHLRQHGTGAATFLPLDRLDYGHEPGTVAVSPPGDDAAAARMWASDQVSTPISSLARYLLGRVCIVGSLDEAETMWRRNGVVATYVTPDGDVLAPTGRLRGGAADAAAAAAHSLLGRKRQLRDLELEVAQLTAALDAAQAETAQLEGEVSTLRARMPLLQQSIRAGESERLAGEKDLEQTIREQERVLRHRETVQAEARQVSGEVDETGRTLDVLDGRMAAAQEAESRHERAMVGLRESIEQAQERDRTLVGELTSCRVELASAKERVEALGRELARIDQIEVDLHDRLTTTRQRQTQLRERAAWLVDERERTDAAAREVAVDRDRVEEETRAAGQHHEGLLAELRLLEGEMRSVESDVSRTVGSIHEVELRATEGRVRLEELVQEAWRAHGVDADGLRALHDPARDLDAARARVAELDEKLSAIGPVNLVADDEYRELDERLTFLRTQHDDLVGSIKDLEKALRGMTRTAQERFTQAFEDINRHFSEIFQRLFEGGRAELRLVEAEEGGDPLDTGVELMAQPRGKKLQAVSLMSGGERALTGLALLFAIFYFRPSPFCVLDEVDAPLDDANIHRFLRVLRELTSQTQFLVITHNRKTMEAADVLYGVTMEEPGLSKLVSVNLGAA
jgi:chromosome segregation protein